MILSSVIILLLLSRSNKDFMFIYMGHSDAYNIVKGMESLQFILSCLNPDIAKRPTLLQMFR